MQQSTSSHCAPYCNFFYSFSRIKFANSWRNFVLVEGRRERAEHSPFCPWNWEGPGPAFPVSKVGFLMPLLHLILPPFLFDQWIVPCNVGVGARTFVSPFPLSLPPSLTHVSWMEREVISACLRRRKHSSSGVVHYNLTFCEAVCIGEHLEFEIFFFYYFFPLIPLVEAVLLPPACLAALAATAEAAEELLWPPRLFPPPPALEDDLEAFILGLTGVLSLRCFSFLLFSFSLFGGNQHLNWSALRTFPVEQTESPYPVLFHSSQSVTWLMGRSSELSYPLFPPPFLLQKILITYVEIY